MKKLSMDAFMKKCAVAEEVDMALEKAERERRNRLFDDVVVHATCVDDCKDVSDEDMLTMMSEIAYYFDGILPHTQMREEIGTSLCKAPGFSRTCVL